jgi:hypothetical protein
MGLRRPEDRTRTELEAWYISKEQGDRVDSDTGRWEMIRIGERVRARGEKRLDDCGDKVILLSKSQRLGIYVAIPRCFRREKEVLDDRHDRS